MTKITINFTVLLLITLISCKKDNNTTDSTLAIPSSTLVNVAYGTDPQQVLDYYLPANRNVNTTKSIILIHGGGWSAGDKSAMYVFFDSLKVRLPDYAFFTINYRLADTINKINRFPTQENDIKNVINFINSNSSSYKISKKFVLLGTSAGGHLALLQAYKYPSPVKIKAVISYFGPTDILDMYNNPVNNDTTWRTKIAAVLGATPVQNSAIYTNSSPINFITNTTPPTLTFHGNIDPVVAFSQSLMLRNKLSSFGVINKLVQYPGGHGDDWTKDNFTDSYNKIKDFVTVNVQ